MDATSSNKRHKAEDDCVLVIRRNGFSKKIDSGYLARNNRRISAMMRPEDIGQYIAAYPSVKIEVLDV